uniref:Uncharacterized protein n=1 Tax=Rhizophora mucronata TaxID=61149 RepID=A0A2P2QT39_RHIMU
MYCGQENQGVVLAIGLELLMISGLSPFGE